MTGRQIIRWIAIYATAGWGIGCTALAAHDAGFGPAAFVFGLWLGGFACGAWAFRK